MSEAPAKGNVKKDPPTSDTGIVDIIGYILFTVLTAAAIWYGWKYGIKWAPAFWAKIQNYGITLGGLIFGKKGNN